MSKHDLVIEQVQDSAARSEDARASFRDGVVGFARELQAEGCTPEQMLVRIRALIVEATPTNLDPAAARAFKEDAVRACIEGYYAK